jgi:hypothetical protein
MRAADARAWVQLERETAPRAWGEITPLEPTLEPARPEPAETPTEGEQAPLNIEPLTRTTTESLKGLAAREAGEVGAVNHPPHYHAESGREVIEIIEAWGLNFSRGNALKYLARAGRKDPAREIEDLLKAQWYIEREIARLRGEEAR